MKVSELKEKLNKYDDNKEVIIRFALSNKDETGYVLKPADVDLCYKDVAIYSDYEDTKEDCEFIGQVDLKALWEQEMRY